ncbi:MAG: class I SAM-dependent methyltransferase [Alphaproteobacteria bacterium]|nr:class I SAM-dependent methyltransferase [Alphaproteobacteria bacterium]
MKRSKPLFIARQSSSPKGILGWIIAKIMSSETAGENEVAVTLLQISDDATVLDAGTGHGRTMTQLLKRVPRGKVIGVDASAVALSIAARTLDRALLSGRATLHCCDMEALPLSEASVDAILTVHTVYFVENLQVLFREFSRVLRPGGQLLLVFRPDSDEIDRDYFPEPVFRFRSLEVVRADALAVGFLEHSCEEDTFKVGLVTFLSLRRG